MRAGFSGRAAWVSLGLVSASLLIYAPVRGYGFVNWDDLLIVGDNPNIAGGLTWRAVRWSLTAVHFSDWHPLTWFSHMLDVQLFGMDAGAHHVTNVVLHIATALLLFALLHRLTGALGRSGFVAALFAVHPLHVESVAWVAARTDVLSTLFWMLTLWGYVWYLGRPGVGRYLFMLLMFALGLMAKPFLVTLPFVLLLIDLWPLGRVSLRVSAADGSATTSLRKGVSEAWPLLVEKVPLFALALVSSVVTFLGRQGEGNVIALGALPVSVRIGNALLSYLAYIEKMLWPVRLAIVYPYPRSIPVWPVTASIAVLIGVSVWAIRRARDGPYWAVGWLWYLGTLVPVIGLVQVGSQSMADRYTYVPLIGLFIMMAWGSSELLARFPFGSIALRSAATLLVAACALRASNQVAYWKDSVSLWSHALDVTSDNSRAHNNLANALMDQGRSVEAIAHYSEAIRVDPDFADAQANLGNAFAKQGRLSDAVAHYNEALRLQPGNANTHNGLGSALDDLGQLNEAIAHYREALRIHPSFADAHNNLGVALAKQGRIDEAISEIMEAIQDRPDGVDFHFNLALLLDQQGRSREAVDHLETALRLNPAHPGARELFDILTSREGWTGSARSPGSPSS